MLHFNLEAIPVHGEDQYNHSSQLGCVRRLWSHLNWFLNHSMKPLMTTIFPCVFPVKFPAEQLQQELYPIFQLIYNQEPESYPFRQPVDPEKEQIPVSVQLLLTTLQS